MSPCVLIFHGMSQLTPTVPAELLTGPHSRSEAAGYEEDIIVSVATLEDAPRECHPFTQEAMEAQKDELFQLSVRTGFSLVCPK